MAGKNKHLLLTVSIGQGLGVTWMVLAQDLSQGFSLDISKGSEGLTGFHDSSPTGLLAGGLGSLPCELSIGWLSVLTTWQLPALPMSNPRVRSAFYDHCHFCLLCWKWVTKSSLHSRGGNQAPPPNTRNTAFVDILQPPQLVWLWFSVTCSQKSSDRYSGVGQDSTIVITWLLVKPTNKTPAAKRVLAKHIF